MADREHRAQTVKILCLRFRVHRDAGQTVNSPDGFGFRGIWEREGATITAQVTTHKGR